MPEFLTSDLVRLHFIERGRGTTAVFYLHGMGFSVGVWHSLCRMLGGASFRHVALDFRGHGLSDRKKHTFTNRRLAKDVIALADALNIPRFAVVGHSFGGKVALQLAALAPHRVVQLVLLGGLGPGKVSVPRQTVRSIMERAQDLCFVRTTFRPWFAVWPNAAIDHALTSFSKTPQWALRSVCKIALWTDITRQCVGIKTPTLIIAGRHDPVYGPEYQRQALVPTLPHAKIVVLNCGHGLMLERPREVAAHVSRFLQSTAHRKRRK